MERELFYPYSTWLKEHFGEKVYKLPVNLPVTCPNRINGMNGCTFCSDQGTGFEALSFNASVTEQLEHSRCIIEKKYKAKKYLAYFQNYTNTFMELEQFEKYVDEAASFDGIVGLSISTRPDCINDVYLELLLKKKQAYQIDINIELGLQTVNYHQLKAINRGHTLAEYIDAMIRIKQYPFSVCTHIIGNLPGASIDDMIETAKIVSVLKSDFVKVHSLYIAKHTKMAGDYQAGKLFICSKEEYFELVGAFLSYLDPSIAIERLFSRIPEKDSVFCNWQTSWWRLKDELETWLNNHDIYQGKMFDYMNGSALRNRMIK